MRTNFFFELLCEQTDPTTEQDVSKRPARLLLGRSNVTPCFGWPAGLQDQAQPTHGRPRPGPNSYRSQIIQTQNPPRLWPFLTRGSAKSEILYIFRKVKSYITSVLRFVRMYRSNSCKTSRSCWLVIWALAPGNKRTRAYCWVVAHLGCSENQMSSLLNLRLWF